MGEIGGGCRTFFNFHVQFRVLDCNCLSLMSVGHTMPGCQRKEAREVAVWKSWRQYRLPKRHPHGGGGYFKGIAHSFKC